MQGEYQQQNICIEQYANSNQLYSTNPMMKVQYGTTNQPKQNYLYEQSIYQLQKSEWQSKGKMKLLYDSFMDINITSITKLKIKRQSGSSIYTIKIVCNDSQQYFYGGSNVEKGQWFVHLAYAKLLKDNKTCKLQQQFINVCVADVWKKNFFGTWQQVYLMITPKDGLTYYFDKKQQPSNHISNISQFWTRFQYIKHGNYLVIKFWKDLFKYQFAIPVNHSTKWLRAFCSVLKF